MSSPVPPAPLQPVGNFLGRILPDKCWVSRNILQAGNTGDILTLRSCGKFSESQGGLIAKVANYLPGFIRTPLGHSIAAFGKLPGVTKLSSFAKGNYFIEAAIGAYQGVKDTITGYQKTEGSFLERVVGGLWSGIKSIGKSAAVLGLSVGTAIAVPALLGVGLTSGVGIVTGFLASMLVASLAKKGMDYLVDTHSHTTEKRDQHFSSGGGLAYATNEEDIVKYIDAQYANRHSNPNYTTSNPFMR